MTRPTRIVGRSLLSPHIGFGHIERRQAHGTNQRRQPAARQGMDESISSVQATTQATMYLRNILPAFAAELSCNKPFDL